MPQRDPLAAFAAAVHADLVQPPADQPTPEDMTDLADGLAAMALSMTGKEAPPMPEGIESAWALAMLQEAASAIPRAHGTAAQISAWLSGYAAALLSAALQVLAVRRGIVIDEDMGWDEMFIEELGGPDLRLVEDED